MCREFAGYSSLDSSTNKKGRNLKGRSIDSAKIYYMMDENNTLEIGFDAIFPLRGKKSILRINASDQSPIGAKLRIELTGKYYDAELSGGYGLQKEDPAHLAQAKTVELKISEKVIKRRGNYMKIQVLGNGWFTWDSLDLRLCKKE